MDSTNMKPLLRGHFHQAAFFFSLGACSMLLVKSTAITFYPLFVYSLSLCALFGISALYHRPNWNSNWRLWMRRLDHCCIFLLIAGTVTPFCLLKMSNSIGPTLLKITWIGAMLGILKSIFWVTSPKWVTAAACVSVGLFALPYLPEFFESLGVEKVTLLLIGGIFYTIGALVYATRFPNPSPKYFGYHEIFHLLVVIAALLQFTVVYSLV